MKKLIYLFVVCFACNSLLAQTISNARSATIGSSVTFKGIVLNGSELGSIRYIQDLTGGISIYGTSLSSVSRGDSILVTGVLTNYNNLLEVTPVTSHITIASNQTLPTPQVLTVSAINDTYEGQLVQFNGCTFANGGATFAGNTNYNVTTGGQTFAVRVTTGSPLVGSVIPNASVNLVGIMSQYCSTPTTGCTTGYQMLLRDANDIINGSSIYLVTPSAAANITNTSFDINWGTNIAGTNSYIKYGTDQTLSSGTVTANNATTHTASLTGLTAGTIYYAKCYSINNTDTATSILGAFATQSLSSGAIKVYFDRTVDTTVSTGTNAIHLNGTIADTIAAYINRAQSSLDICIYNWDSYTNGMKIVTAVNNAYTRNVNIRLIYDGSTNNSALSSVNSAIKQTASPLGADYTIMHDKFVIIDAHSTDPNAVYVLTGSTNWTSSQLATDANNLIIFQDQSLALGYKLEFDEMWGDASQTSSPNSTLAKFGQFKTDNTPHTYNVGGKKVESYFSPSDQTNTKILATIATANTDLEFCQFVVTRSDIAYAIKNQIQNNTLNAKGIIDDTTSSATVYSILTSTMANNLAPYGHSWLLHHKYLIVDQSNTASDPIVLTGSHNWSNAGDQKNDENTVIVHDATIANIYYQEFMARWCERDGATCGSTAGITAIADEKTLSVYPNPSNGNFNITIETTDHATASINLFDFAGRNVYKKQEQVNNGSNTLEIKTNQLAKGMYMLQLNINEQVLTKKIIVE